MNKSNYIKILTLAMLFSFSSAMYSCGDANNTSTTSSHPIKEVWNGKCYSGPLAPKMHLGNTRDFYVETLDGDIHYKINQEEWIQITNVSELPFVYGSNFWNLHIDYEGYFCVDDQKTEVLVFDYLKEGVLENTLELKDTHKSMTKLVDARNQIALMGHYKPNAKLTHYNEVLVEEVSLYTNGIGAI